MSSYPRDLVGYGKNPPHAKWPDNARIAISFVLNYEEGGERCILHGDSESEAFLSEMPSAVPFEGVRHMSMESIYEYGSRAGVWRLLKLFEENDIPLTIFAVAMALERHPDLAKSFVDAGHEICSHALRWITYQDMSIEQEREHLYEAIEIIERVTGGRPLGWYTGRDSPNTRQIVMEEGGFLYDSDSYADDLPYWVDGPKGKHLVIPYTLDTNDMRFAQVQGFNNGEQFFQYLKDSFDTLYEEGAEAPKMLSIGMHCRLLGRPGRIAGLKRFVNYVKQHEGVWFARRVDIARHWHEHHAPENTTFTFGDPTALDRESFVQRLGGVYEHSPWIAERTFDKGLGETERSIEGLQAAMAAVFLSASKDEQLGVIRAHPDLAGKAARAGELTKESTSEQASAGIDSLTDSEFTSFTELNERYKARFGFPFIMAVKGSNKHAILGGFKERIENSPEAEFDRALQEINKIAAFRLAEL